METQTIFDVLRLLEDAKVSFRLARDRPDTIRVDATLCGLRLEIECFDDQHIEVSTFRGDEDIDGDFEYLREVIAKDTVR